MFVQFAQSLITLRSKAFVIPSSHGWRSSPFSLSSFKLVLMNTCHWCIVIGPRIIPSTDDDCAQEPSLTSKNLGQCPASPYTTPQRTVSHNAGKKCLHHHLLAPASGSAIRRPPRSNNPLPPTFSKPPLVMPRAKTLPTQLLTR